MNPGHFSASIVSQFSFRESLPPCLAFVAFGVPVRCAAAGDRVAVRQHSELRSLIARMRCRCGSLRAQAVPSPFVYFAVPCGFAIVSPGAAASACCRAAATGSVDAEPERYRVSILPKKGLMRQGASPLSCAELCCGASQGPREPPSGYVRESNQKCNRSP